MTPEELIPLDVKLDSAAACGPGSTSWNEFTYCAISSVPKLLSAIAAQAARIESLRTALRQTIVNMGGLAEADVSDEFLCHAVDEAKALKEMTTKLLVSAEAEFKRGWRQAWNEVAVSIDCDIAMYKGEPWADKIMALQAERASQAAQIAELEGESKSANAHIRELATEVEVWKSRANGALAEAADLRAELDRLKRELAAAEERAEKAEGTWTCFHCGFQSSDPTEAKAHFGDRDEEEPLCLTWNGLCEHGRANEYQSALQQLDAERFENQVLSSKIEGLEYRCESQTSEIHSFAPFRGCDTIHAVFNVYDSMEGRALLAEEQLAASQAQNTVLREAINGALHTSRERATAPGRSARLCTPPMDKSWSDLAKWCVDGFELTESILTAALAATPAASLAMVKTEVLREAANLIRQTTPDQSLTEWYRGCASGRRYAIDQIEEMASGLEAAAKGEKDA